ncbi:hypothetical protein Bbelb_139910 [Branchiostoma belcheri]|nr:hypothetical protein Bbelb_139910 [Branchiostoma belcheri]
MDEEWVIEPCDVQQRGRGSVNRTSLPLFNKIEYDAKPHRAFSTKDRAPLPVIELAAAEVGRGWTLFFRPKRSTFGAVLIHPPWRYRRSRRKTSTYSQTLQTSGHLGTVTDEGKKCASNGAATARVTPREPPVYRQRAPTHPSHRGHQAAPRATETPSGCYANPSVAMPTPPLLG